MHFFTELGEEIARAWAAVGHDPAAFTELAFRTLRARSPHGHVTPDEIVQWALETPALPKQHDLEASFGQPPVTLYEDDRFVVEALFWVDGTTSIHQHAFSGAFQVLAGSSLHARYEFARRTLVSPRLLLGALHAGPLELLRTGDVRAIASGPGFVHSLFHLDRPSVTLLVRTRQDAGVERQYAYLPPSVAFDPFEREAAVTRRQQLLGMLFTVDPALYPAAATTALAHADAEATFHLLRQAKKVDTAQVFDGLCARARDRHGEVVDALLPSIEEERRRADVAELRNRITDPDLRYFLALMLNADGRASVHALTRARVPERPSADTLFDWLRALSATRFTLQAGPASFEVSAVGVPLDDVTLRVAQLVLAGVAPEALADQLPGVARSRIEQATKRLHELRLLAPLFAD